MTIARRIFRLVLAWSLLTLAWCAFVIALSSRLMAQPVSCFQIEGTGELCIPSDGQIFVDVAAAPAPNTGSRARIDQPFQAAAATPRIILAHQKLASDGWVDRAKNKKGERCCDAGKDCHKLSPEQVKEESRFFTITLPDMAVSISKELAMPSEDGHYWICIVENQVRCFFRPYSGS